MSISAADATEYLRHRAVSVIRTRIWRDLAEGRADAVHADLNAAREAGDQVVIDAITSVIAYFQAHEADVQNQELEFNAWCDQQFRLAWGCLVIVIGALAASVLNFIPSLAAAVTVTVGIPAAWFFFTRPPPKRFGGEPAQ